MNALAQAAELQQQAIDLLLNEREMIDQRLAQLGNGELHIKRRGRPKKSEAPEQEKAPE
ncbi:MAG: hypothetical protein ABSE27_12685 [Acidobacteriaceae bacterium]|jgi:hypothetical protein